VWFSTAACNGAVYHPSRSRALAAVTPGLAKAVALPCTALSGRCMGVPATPLLSCGHDLGYTTFGCGLLRLAGAPVDVGGETSVSLSLTNTEQRVGTEVVQLHADDTAPGVTLPTQQLIGLARVDLEPGASTTITLTAPMRPRPHRGLRRGDDGTRLRWS
jgi:hypothetical protein